MEMIIVTSYMMMMMMIMMINCHPHHLRMFTNEADKVAPLNSGQAKLLCVVLNFFWRYHQYDDIQVQMFAIVL